MTPALILATIREALVFANSPAGQRLLIEVIEDSNKLESRLESLGAKLSKLKIFNWHAQDVA